MYTNRRNQKVKLFCNKSATTQWYRISVICGAEWYECSMSWAKVLKEINKIRDEKSRKELKAYFKSLW